MDLDFRVPEMTTARLTGRVAGGSTGPGCRDGLALVMSLRQGDPVPSGHDVGGPGPDGLDPQAPSAAAAGQPAAAVQDAVPSAVTCRPFSQPVAFTL